MDYNLLTKQVNSLFENETNVIANMANLSALLFSQLKDINWAGFYIRKQEELILGPFQGNIACVRIQLGKGVCGTSAAQGKTVIVENVHEFPGHIVCDAASNSEIVIPVIVNNKVIAVLDIDSPLYKRFDEDDKKGLENLLDSFIKHTDFSTL